LPSLVLVPIDQPGDEANGGRVVTGCDDVFDAPILFYVKAQDGIELLVGREAVGVLLVGTQFG